MSTLIHTLVRCECIKHVEFSVFGKNFGAKKSFNQNQSGFSFVVFFSLFNVWIMATPVLFQ